MMKSQMLMVSMVALSLGAVSAFAGDDNAAGKDGGKGSGQAASAISLDEFRERCLDPNKFIQQKQPQNIRIQCTDTQLEYVAAEPGYVPLGGARRVHSTLLSDKFVVAAGDGKDLPVIAQKGSCLRFKEIEKTLTVERPMSCNEIVGMKATVDEYCISALDAVKGKNPKLASVRETGKLVDSCAGVMGTVPGKDGKPKQQLMSEELQ